jgi:hypothetical protein
MEHALGPTADPAWVLDADGYDPLREGSVESRFAISNGFLGIRGARATTRGARWIVCGRDLRQGKPNPEIFLLAAAELRIAPAHCFVAEYAPAGIEAAKAGRMMGLGVARLGDAVPLRTAGAIWW